MKNNDITQMELTLLNAGWAKDDERWNFGPICSTFMRIYWVTRGSAYVTLNGKEHMLTEGHFYLIPPLITHYDRSDGVFEHYYFHVSCSTQMTEQVFGRYTLPFEVESNQACCKFFVEIARRFPELKLPQPEPDSYETTPGLVSSARRFAQYPIGVRYEINGILLQLFSRFLNSSTERAPITDNRIGESVWLIEKNMTRSIAISELASRASLSKEQFIRLFHRQMGQTPTAYIISRKIAHAQMLFAQHHLTVKEVALQLGYQNISYFCRSFRKLVGMSPRQFILQNQ